MIILKMIFINSPFNNLIIKLIKLNKYNNKNLIMKLNRKNYKWYKNNL